FPFLFAHSLSFSLFLPPPLLSFAGAGGWSPDREDRQPWLQLDLKDRLEVTAISTQGRWGSLDWVSSYHLQYSDSGRNWRSYRQDNVPWTFPGNTDTHTVVQHKLLHSIRTRFLRILPLEGSPSGGIGLRLEIYGCTYKSDVADFDGRGALLYRFNQKSTSTVKNVIALRFRSRQADGVLVHGAGQRGDYITLELQGGRLTLHLNLDHLDVRLPSYLTVGPVSWTHSLLDDHLWHSVHIERFNKQVNFTVDRDTQHFLIQGQEDSLEVDYELSFGGIPLPGKPGTFLRENFHGCLENLYYNGVNVIDMAKRRKPQIYIVGNVTFSCSESQPIAVTFSSTADSFMALPADVGGAGLSVRLHLRTWNRDGRLLLAPLAGAPHPTLLLLQLSGGALQLLLQGPTQQTAETAASKGCTPAQRFSVSVCAWSHQLFVVIYFSHTHSWPFAAIYERSCEAYRKTGSPSGMFTVDPDGSGPLENTRVNCSMADKIWTVVGHDHLQPVSVRGSTPRSPYVLIFNYSISPYHLRSLVSSSDYCQQEVTYRCRKSRSNLLITMNTNNS
uniref:Contactin associated protein family member 5 like n=1 Tax=Electrophorus electricus TaxID=8005 RepID=A0AAY5EIU1_ELEEL